MDSPSKVVVHDRIHFVSLRGAAGPGRVCVDLPSRLVSTEAAPEAGLLALKKIPVVSRAAETSQSPSAEVRLAQRIPCAATSTAVFPNNEEGDPVRVRARIAESAIEHRYAHGDRAVSVAVECVVDTLHGWSDGAQVDVADAGILHGAEVLISDIAPADDGKMTSGDPRPVVHPPVEPGAAPQQLNQGAHRAGRRRGRIRQPNLDLRVGMEGLRHRILAAHIVIVDQQASRTPRSVARTRSLGYPAPDRDRCCGLPARSQRA